MAGERFEVSRTIGHILPVISALALKATIGIPERTLRAQGRTTR